MRPMIVATLAAIALASGHECRGQNDWQYPDPYFGILEIEKSRSTPGAERAATQVERPRASVRPSTGRGVLRGSWSRRWARLRGPQPH